MICTNERVVRKLLRIIHDKYTTRGMDNKYPVCEVINIYDMMCAPVTKKKEKKTNDPSMYVHHHHLACAWIILDHRWWSYALEEYGMIIVG